MGIVKRNLWRDCCFAFGAVVASAQQPVAIGPSAAGNSGLGVVKFFDWYNATATGGCTNGSVGYCVGHDPQGDTYYWTAWMPNASGLPVTSGLPVVGTINDYSFGPICSGNLGILQLDTFNWASPAASHMSKVNCMASFGTAPGGSNAPAGWNGHLTSSDSVGNAGTWKSRVPFSKGGILYLPVERQISAGNASVHDATYLMSPDSGKHWCNPNTWANRAGGPGCDSSNWDANGDAPKCDATSSSTPCTNAGYLDSAHSSIMWKALPLGTENWVWINYGYQDGQTPPTGVNDGCDPTAYTCFMLVPGEGSLARVANTDSILDVSAWRYYTCPAITQNYRCPGSDPANWTATFANRTPVLATSYPLSTFEAFLPDPYGLMYVKEFGSYIMPGRGTGFSSSFSWAPRLQGPWTTVFWAGADNVNNIHFLSLAPALGYNIISTDPPHVQITTSSNSYSGGQGSPNLAMWDFVLGRQISGSAFQSMNLHKYVSGAGYQFSDGHMPGSLPRNGLVWSFDFLDAGVNSGLTNWPYFLDRGNNSAVVTPCDGGYAGTTCGFMNATHGMSMNNYGIFTSNTDYGGHFQTAPGEMALGRAQNAPSAMQGNGSYTVVGVYRYEGTTPFNRPGGIWSTGTITTSDNTMIEFNQVNGKVELDWGATSKPHYQYLSNFTFPNFTNWYFIAVTVQAQTECGGTARLPQRCGWVAR